MVSIDVIEKMALQVSDHITLKEIFQEKKGKKPLRKTEDPVSPCEIKQVLDRLKVGMNSNPKLWKMMKCLLKSI